MTSTLTPRSYQKSVVTTICQSHFNTNSRIVLAAATGSGKTEMAIMIIEHFIKHNLGRVLVIAHHTNIIKSNFVDRLNDVSPNFTYSDSDQSVDCFVAIRSTSLNNVDTAQFSLIIVDEAHQNYFANTIQTIVSDIAHQVLLTATPSKFVSVGGFDILPVARLDIPNEYFASLSFRVVNAETSLTTDSYNNDNVVKTSVKFHRSEVKSIVDSIIPFIDDSKKLFICKDIEQAKSTARYLTQLGFNTYVSDSKSDPDNVIANSFKSNDINSLCVVDRMRVGYSDNNLYHTVDMSFTHNPDVIMQILSRSNRGNQSQSKSYIKVTNQTLNLRTRVMLSVALSLFRSDNLISFDGTFASVNIPVTKSSSASRQASAPSDSWFIPDSVDFIDFFSDCDFVNADDIIRRFYGYTDYDYCVSIAKNYSSFVDFKNNNATSYQWLRRNGLIDKFVSDCNFTKRTLNFTDYSTYSDEQLSLVRGQYVNSTDFSRHNRNAYLECCKRGVKASYSLICTVCDCSFTGSYKATKFCPECKKKVQNDHKKAHKLKVKLSK